MKRFKNSSGQALLIVLLSLSVVLIIVLYIVSRSITDINISTQDESALRAFSAAEAGIERALIVGSDTGDTLDNNARFVAQVDSFAVGEQSVVYPASLKSGQTATFWFVSHNNDGTLGCTSGPCFNGSKIKFCWGTPGTTGTVPAIEASFVYASTPGDMGTLRVARATLDPVVSRRNTNKFSPATTGTCQIGSGNTFSYYKTLDLTVPDVNIPNYTTKNVLQYVRVRMLYNDTNPHKLGMDVSESGSGFLLPSQGTIVESTGTSGDANRKVRLVELFPVAPSIFDNVLFSGSGIIK